MSHRYIYNPAPTPAQQRVAPNPWDDPPDTQQQVATTAANPGVSNMTGHHYVYVPTPAPPTQQAASNPWDQPAPAGAPANSWTLIPHPSVTTVVHPVIHAFPVLLAPPPAAMHYPGTGVQFYQSAPAAEPHNFQVYQGKPADNIAYHHTGGDNSNAIQMVPQNPTPDDQFYCRELDGAYTLKTGTTIMRDCQPGYWKHGKSGYPYWVRAA